MNKWEKEVMQSLLSDEEAVLKELERYYREALDDIELNIKILQADEQTASRIHRVEYQKALRKQISDTLDLLHSGEYKTINDFLNASYNKGFAGTMYSLHGQGMPMILPIDHEMAIRAIMTDSKLSEPLYDALGVDIQNLKKRIAAEVTRGIAQGMSNDEIARNLRNTAKAPLGRARTIARTESHRIHETASHDAAKKAVSKGANLVKQWDASLDDATRDTHRQLDGKIVEMDEYFVSGTKKALYPGQFGDPAEDCNCRCNALHRSRSKMNADELQTLKERAEYFGLDKTADFEEFEKKYLNIANEWASADTELSNFLGADSRDNLTEIEKRGIIKMQQGFSAFPDGDVLAERAKLVAPKKNFFDVAMHGSQSAVGFGSGDANMSPRLLASFIRHADGYNGQNIRLLSCNTGNTDGVDICFAEELANALGVLVEAPNDYLLIEPNGNLRIGYWGNGSMKTFKPNERRRLK